ncbi:MAG: transcription termination factor NusA, partial [Alkalispirochaeta sp.]
LPKRYQSPREAYRTNDRIKALIVDVVKGNTGLQIALSRTHTDLVKRVFELEVPEIYGKTVEIVRIVREAGYRTKIAVASNREDVDPVGACVGLRGVRIQAIVRELEGEKIDILKFDPDPRVLIKNALSPAEVTNVVVLDEARRQALAIVPEDQLSLAIGKQGLNVRLANRLADWNIDVKTMDQFDELDIAAESKRAVSALFRDHDEEPEDEITSISELPGITDEMVRILEANNITMIEEIVGLSDEDLHNLDGMNPDIVTDLSSIIAENVEIVEEEDNEYEYDESEEEEYEEEPEVETPERTDTEVYSAGDEQIEQDDRAEDEADEEEEVITEIGQLPSMTEAIVAKLNAAGVADLEDLINLDPNNLQEVEGLTEDEAATIRTILTEYVEIVEGDEE